MDSQKTRKVEAVSTEEKKGSTLHQFYTKEHIPTGKPMRDFFMANRWETTVFFLFFVLNALYSLGMRYPVLTDEHITMAEGIYLWGGADQFASAYAGANYYGYSYSVLYGWLYHITQNMQLVFRLSLLLNSFFIAFVPVLAYRISRQIFGLRASAAAGLSVVAGLYPAAVVYTKYALNETMLFLLPLAVAYLLLLLYSYKLTRKMQVLYTLCAGFLSAYAYTVHGRGIALVISAFIALILVAVRKRKAGGVLLPILFLVAAGVTLFVDSLVKGYLMQNFLQTVGASSGNSLARVLGVNMAGAFEPKNIVAMLRGLLGQSFYMMCATFGMGAFFVVAFISLLRRHKATPTARVRRMIYLGTFILLFALLSLLISTAFLSGLYVTDELVRAEYYVYGRYTEAACLLIVFAVLLYFALGQRPGRAGRITAAALFAAIMLGGVFVAGSRVEAAGGQMSYSMVPSILPFMGPLAWQEATLQNFALLAAVVSILYVAISLLQLYGRQFVAMLLMGGVFAWSFNYTLFAFVYPQSQKRYRMVQPYEQLGVGLGGLSDQFPRIYVDYFSPPVHGLQFALPQYEMHFLNKEEQGFHIYNSIEPDSLIVSKYDQPLDLIFSDVYSVDTLGDTHVWVYGDVLRSQLEAMGYPAGRWVERDAQLFAGSKLGAGAGAHTEGDAMILAPGGMQFGPYTSIWPGKWTVRLSGAHLGYAECSITSDQGSVYSDITQFDEQESTVLSYSFVSNGSAEGIEFITRNGGNVPLVIDRMELIYEGPLEEIGLQQSDIYAILHRNYDVYSSPLYRGDQFHFSEECTKGQTGLHMRPSGTMEVSGISFRPGTHQLLVSGPGIEAADIRLEGNGSFEITSVEKLEDSIACTLTANETLENVTLHVSNDSDEDIVYRGLGVNVLRLDSGAQGIEWRRAK